MPSLLLAAATVGSLKQVKDCLQGLPYDVWERDADGNSPLHLAARHGGRRLVKLIYDHQPAVAHARNSRGDNVLHVAARHGNAAAVGVLTRAANGTLVYWQNNDAQVPLDVAVAMYIDLTREQIRTSNLEELAGIMAALEAQRDCVTALLKATPAGVTTPPTSLIHAACCMNHHALVSMLLERVPDAGACLDLFGAHPIHNAASSGAVDVVRLLLRHDASCANAVNAVGETPLHGAVTTTSVDTVDALLRAAPHAATRFDHCGCSPLVVAAQHGVPCVIELLLQAAPQMARVGDMDDCLPIWLACWYGNRCAVEVLIKAAPDTAAAYGGYGHNALHVAADQSWPCVAEVLLRHQPHLAATRTQGDNKTALQLALLPEHIDPDVRKHDRMAGSLVRLLMRSAPETAAVRMADEDDMLPLHVAASVGMETCVQELLCVYPEAVGVCDGTGMLPLERAIDGDHPDIVDALVRAPRQDPARVLRVLRASNLDALVGVAVEAHLPLSPECWALVPPATATTWEPLPLLSVAVQRGTPADVRHLVARLCPEDDVRLRAMLCSLRRACPGLPVELTQHLVTLACAG